MTAPRRPDGRVRWMPTEQLEAHPASLAIPRPRPSELAALADDVSRRGVLEPLRLAGDGRTLDGATRLAVARELGLAAVPTLSAQCEPGEELAYAIRQATLRRHLSDDQRAMLAVRLAAELGGERGRVQRQAAARARWQPDRGSDAAGTAPMLAASAGPRSRTVAVRALGVSQRRFELAQALSRDAPDLAEQVVGGALPLLVARAQVERRVALAALSAQPATDLPEAAEVWEGDAFELAACLPDGSVDFLLTDPPWGGDALDVWPRLGQLAARVLRPGGFAAVYCGHLHMPRQLTGLLDGGLDWHWMVCVSIHGHHPAVRARRVRTMWRPVALLRQRGDGEAPWFGDRLMTDPTPQKALHPWQQSLGPARALIRRFSLPGQLVLDAFAGAGTFSVAAVLEGRRTLAIERDPGHAATARARIAQAVAERDGQAQASA